MLLGNEFIFRTEALQKIGMPEKNVLATFSRKNMKHISLGIYRPINVNISINAIHRRTQLPNNLNIELSLILVRLTYRNIF